MKSKRLLILLLLALIVPWAATAQNPIPYNEGFENMSSASDLATAGWITYNSQSGSVLKIETAASNVHSGDKALNMDSYSCSTNSAIFVAGLPVVNAAIKTLQITFSYKISSSYGGTFDVGYLTDASDASTYVSLQPFANSTSYTTETVELDEAPDNAARIAIKYTGYYRCYVDDIKVEVIPTCPKPALNPEVATTNTTATVSWTPSGDNQQLFDLYWSTSSTAPTAATTPSVANYEGNSYVFNFADLNPSSTYYVWVRGNCGTATNPDVSGGWTTSSVSFETPCEAITNLPWMVDFEDMTANTVPQCWDNSASTTSDVTNNPQYVWGVYSYSSSNKVLRMYNYYVHTGTALINTPSITLPANSEYMLYFDYAHGANCGAFQVKISEDGGTTFVEKGSYNNNSGTFTAATPIDLSSYAGKTIIVQFFANANYGSGAIYVDNVRVDLPTPTITSVESTSPLSTTVTWTGASSATGYVYQYKLQDATEWGQEHAVGNSVLSADITTVADGQYDFRLKAQYGTNYSSWVTTQFTAPGYCMVPSDLVITNVTWSQAELSWTEEFGDGEWTLLYKTSLEEEYTTYGTVTSSDMPVTLPGLNVNTTYNVKIYPNCDATKFITDQFTTKCEPITEPSWEENFESYDATTYSYSSGHSYDLTASCWKNEHISGAGTYLFQISSYSSTTGNTTKKLVLPDMTSGTMTKLCLPGFMIPTGTNYQFALDIYRNTSDYPTEGIRIYASTNGEIEGATELAFISRNYTVASGTVIPAENATGWYSYEIPIPFDGICYIILRGESQYGSSTYMDNFAIEPVPTCHRPRNLAYTPASLTNHSVTLTWTAPEGQTAWQIAYSTTEFNPNNAGFDLSTVSTQNVTGENPTYHFDKTLEADTTYYMYVRSNCGTAEAPDYSKWSREGCRFHTKIVKPYPTSLVASEKLPTSLKLGWTIGGGDYETAWDIYYSTSSEDVPTDETEPTIAGVTDNPHLIEGLAANTYYYFYVRSVHSDAGASAWSSALYTNTPEACPKPSSLTVAEPTPTSLKLSWTAGAAWQTAWTIAYSTTTGFDPTDGTACTYVDAPTNPFVVEGLDSEQTYYFRVKGACAEYEATSQWNSSQATGTTLVNCPIPTTANATNVTPHTATLNWTGYSESYNVQYRTAGIADYSEDFSGQTPVGYSSSDGQLPEGWHSFNSSSSGYAPRVSDGTKYTYISMTGNYLLMTTNAYDQTTYAIMPRIMGIDSVAFKYKYESTYNGTFTVGYVTDNTGYSTYVPLQTPTKTTTVSTYTLTADDITTINNANGYIAFRYVSGNSTYYSVGVDDIFVKVSNPTPAGEWIAANNGESIEGTSVDIAALVGNTNYEWQVQATCALDEENDWSASGYFITLSVCTVPVADSAINITYNSADLYWTGYQDEYNVRYRHYVKNTQPATVILTAGNIWGDGTGYQMLLDADATAYGTIIIPTDGGLTNSGDASAETYAEFEYKIPINADGAMTTQNIVMDSSISIQIPAGIYDWCITNPTPGDRIWIAGDVGNVPGCYDDFVFMPGATYEFTMVTDGVHDGVFLTATYPWSEWTTIDESITTTNYELGGLDDETIYEWQVKGLGECTEGTDWSESDYFETEKAYRQTIALTAGWNWISTNVKITMDDLKAALVDALPGTAITIKSKSNGFTNYVGNKWKGQLSTIDYTQMYQVQVTSDCEISLVTGASVDPSEYPITIYPGANWIAFQLDESMSLSDAFAGFAVSNDNVRSKGNGFANYTNKWKGGLTTLVPGQGYVYTSPSTTARVFTYPINRNSAPEKVKKGVLRTQKDLKNFVLPKDMIKSNHKEINK